MVKVKYWGQLTAIDLHSCDSELLKNRKKLWEFCLSLCKKIKMKPYGKPVVKRFGEGYLKGLSAMLFIETSTITVHLDEFGNRAFIDIFSCKKFSEKAAKTFSKEFFKAKRVVARTVLRG